MSRSQSAIQHQLSRLRVIICRLFRKLRSKSRDCRSRWRQVLMVNHAGGGQRPVAKQRLSVNVLLRHQSPDPRITRVVAIISHYEVVVRPDINLRLATVRQIQMRIKIALLQIATINSYHALVNLHCFPRQSDDTLDIALRRIVREPKNHDIAAIELGCPTVFVVVDQFIYKDSLAVVEPGQHRRPFNLYWLNHEYDNEGRYHQGED